MALVSFGGLLNTASFMVEYGRLPSTLKPIIAQATNGETEAFHKVCDNIPNGMLQTPTEELLQNFGSLYPTAGTNPNAFQNKRVVAINNDIYKSIVRKHLDHRYLLNERFVDSIANIAYGANYGIPVADRMVTLYARSVLEIMSRGFHEVIARSAIESNWPCEDNNLLDWVKDGPSSKDTDTLSDDTVNNGCESGFSYYMGNEACIYAEHTAFVAALHCAAEQGMTAEELTAPLTNWFLEGIAHFYSIREGLLDKQIDFGDLQEPMGRPLRSLSGEEKTLYDAAVQNFIEEGGHIEQATNELIGYELFYRSIKTDPVAAGIAPGVYLSMLSNFQRHDEPIMIEKNLLSYVDAQNNVEQTSLAVFSAAAFLHGLKYSDADKVAERLKSQYDRVYQHILKLTSDDSISQWFADRYFGVDDWKKLRPWIESELKQIPNARG